MVEEGTLSAKEANKFVTKMLDLEIDETTFIIPDKCHSYNSSCVAIENIEEYHKKVQLVFTSVDNYSEKTKVLPKLEKSPQPGHESTAKKST
jgi:hypothetical protein